jgi:uroporphyrin-III C-methyltransferase
MNGRVYLMGAGPGDPDLLTVTAARVLRQAEVVFHDDLVAPEILELVPAWAQVLNVGKRSGQTCISQDKINSLLVHAARDGKKVVRLKGGDPLLFGRVGEEMEALAEAGIPFEVVAGVTSASGAAAAAKIPLTDRRFASKLVFVSNHGAGNEPASWHDVVSQDATVVVYMPGPDYGRIATKLIAAGLDADTPCLLVARATRSEQQLHRSTLAQLAVEPRLPAPALLIVGEVTRVRPAATAEFLTSLETVISLEEASHASEPPVEAQRASRMHA